MTAEGLEYPVNFVATPLGKGNKYPLILAFSRKRGEGKKKEKGGVKGEIATALCVSQ